MHNLAVQDFMLALVPSCLSCCFLALNLLSQLSPLLLVLYEALVNHLAYGPSDFVRIYPVRKFNVTNTPA